MRLDAVGEPILVAGCARTWTTFEQQTHRRTESWAYCPACSCRRSGYATEPNGVDECCTTDGACLCHDANWTEPHAEDAAPPVDPMKQYLASLPPEQRSELERAMREREGR